MKKTKIELNLFPLVILIMFYFLFFTGTKLVSRWLDLREVEIISYQCNYGGKITGKVLKCNTKAESTLQSLPIQKI